MIFSISDKDFLWTHLSTTISLDLIKLTEPPILLQNALRRLLRDRGYRLFWDRPFAYLLLTRGMYSTPSVRKTTFFTGNLQQLVNTLKSDTGKNIYCDGGAEVINALLKQALVDDFIISVIPVLLGNGIKLFKDGNPEQLLQFVHAETFDTGLIQLHYRK